MLKHASVKILLDKELFYGGDCLKGVAQLKVRRSEEITYMQVHIQADKNVNVRVTTSYETYNNNNFNATNFNPNNFGSTRNTRSRDYPYSESLLNFEATIFSEPKIFSEGTHALPFEIPLPPNLPPSVFDSMSDMTYGKNVYKVKIRLGRKKHGVFSRNELTDQCGFSYSPLQYVDDFNLPEQLTAAFRFRDYLHSKGIIGGIKNSLGQTTHDPNSMLDIVFTFPERGLRQDMGNKFNIVVHAPVNTRPILVSHVILDIEASVFVSVDNHDGSAITQRANLVDRRMNQEGSIVDLEPILANVKPNIYLVPSFISPCHSHTTKLHLQMTVKQNSHDGAKIAHVKTSVNMNVLSGKVTQTLLMNQAPPPY